MSRTRSNRSGFGFGNWGAVGPAGRSGVFCRDTGMLVWRAGVVKNDCNRVFRLMYAGIVQIGRIVVPSKEA